MIATLSGILQHKDPSSVILDVQGVGYEVQLSSRTYDKLPLAGEKAFLHIHTNVREDAITLYGFTDMDQKNSFSFSPGSLELVPNWPCPFFLALIRQSSAMLSTSKTCHG